MARINSRTKGATGEREFCKWLNENFGEYFDETAERNLLQTREGGGDIVIGDYIFEIKRVEKLSLQKWWLQVREAVTAKNKYSELDYKYEGIVAYRQNKKQWQFLISASHIGCDFGYLALTHTVFKKWFLNELEKQSAIAH